MLYGWPYIYIVRCVIRVVVHLYIRCVIRVVVPLYIRGVIRVAVHLYSTLCYKGGRTSI